MLRLGHQLSSRPSLRLEINMSLLGGDPHDTWSLRVTPEIKWDLFGGRLTPFLWSGAGLAYAAVYPGPESAATLVIPVGVGIQRPSGRRSSPRTTQRSRSHHRRRILLAAVSPNFFSAVSRTYSAASSGESVSWNRSTSAMSMVRAGTSRSRR